MSKTSKTKADVFLIDCSIKVSDAKQAALKAAKAKKAQVPNKAQAVAVDAYAPSAETFADKSKKQSFKSYKANTIQSYADAKKKAFGVVFKPLISLKNYNKIETFVAKAFELPTSSTTTACSTPGTQTPVAANKKVNQKFFKPRKISIVQSYADAKKKALGITPKPLANLAALNALEAFVAKTFALTPSSTTTAASTPGAATPPVVAPLKAPTSTFVPSGSKFVENFDAESLKTSSKLTESKPVKTSKFAQLFSSLTSSVSAAASAVTKTFNGFVSQVAQTLSSLFQKFFGAKPKA